MKYQFSYDALDLVAQTAPSHFGTIVEELALANDRDSLRIVKSLADRMALAHLPVDSWRTICFSVLHLFDPEAGSKEDRVFANEWMQRFGVEEKRFNLEDELVRELTGLSKDEHADLDLTLSRCRALVALGARPFFAKKVGMNQCAATHLINPMSCKSSSLEELEAFKVSLLKTFLKTSPHELPMLQANGVSVEIIFDGEHTKVKQVPEEHSLFEQLLQDTSANARILEPVLEIYGHALGRQKSDEDSTSARLRKSVNEAYAKVFADGTLTMSRAWRTALALAPLLEGDLDPGLSQALWSSRQTYLGTGRKLPYPIVALTVCNQEGGHALFERFLDRMIDDGVDIDAPIETMLGGGTEHNTLLARAVSDHQLEAVRTLIARGADIFAPSISKGIDGEVIAGSKTPLDIAVEAAASALDNEAGYEMRSIATILRSREAQLTARAALVEIGAAKRRSTFSASV